MIDFSQVDDIPYVEVIWQDHNGSSGWEDAGSFVRTAAPDLCVSRGWLVGETDEALILASSQIPGKERTIGGKEVIIKSCVESIAEFEIR